MLWEILKASKGILVADLYADLWAHIAGGGTPVDVFVEMIGSLPLYYDGKGIDLADYLISGNTLQDGTPSPEAPVDAVGCGVRTGNLLSEKYENRSINSAGAFAINSDYDLWLGEVVAGQTYTISNMDFAYGFFTEKPLPNTGVTYDGSRGLEPSGTAVVTVPSGCTWIAVRVLHSANNAMLNLGSEALPYEPYGYKLPLTVNGTEYPIYLGQVESTRRIKKLVLTGEEASWAELAAGLYRITVNGYLRESDAQIAISTHFSGGITVSAAPSAKQDTVSFLVSASGNNYVYFSPSQYLTLNDFKAYLAAQYTAGTPVTVWYVLATPETAVVNEPLMKIGDYSDTISAAQAGVTIPTVSGANVLDMASPVKPSEMYIKGKGIKPTGYGQLTDVNSVDILDKDGTKILVHGQ